MDQIPTRTEALDATPLRLEMRHISKSFGGVRALEDVSFRAGAGEVVALCGENGAGKSTLMKILAGAIVEYDGEILLSGRHTRFSGPRDAEDAGIRIIYQELNLVPQLSVAGNVFLGREKTWGKAAGWLDNRAMERETQRLFDRSGAAVAPARRVGDLRIGDQQMVEIARALAFDAEVVIMDEPTSALADSEVARLFRVIADLRRAGTTVLYISHKMNEIMELADHVVVLRDGQFVATGPRAEISPQRIVRWMVGREIAALDYVQHPIGEAPHSRSIISRSRVLPAAAGPTCGGSHFPSMPARCWASQGCSVPAEPSCRKRSSAPVHISRLARSASKVSRFTSRIPTRRSGPESP